MAKIPAPTLVNPRFSGVEVPRGVFGNPTQALANVVSAVNGAVDKVVEMGFEAQDLKNKADTRAKLRELRNMQTQFQNDVFENNIPPEQWVPQWEAKLKAFENSLGTSGAPPDVRNAVMERYEDFAASSTLQIGGAMVKENRRRAKEIYQLDTQDLMVLNKTEDAHKLVDEAVKDKVLDDHEAEIAHRNIDRTKNINDRDAELTLNPTGYLEDLEAGKYNDQLSPVQLFEEREKAEVIISSKERDYVIETKQMFEVGMIKDEAEFEAQLSDKPEVSLLTKKVLRKELFERKKINEPLTYEERFKIADNIADNFKQLQEGKLNIQEYTILHNQIQTTLEVLGNRPGTGPLRERAYRVDPSQFIADDGSGKVDKEAAAKKAAEFKDAELAMEALVRERASGITAVDLAGKATPEDDNIKGKIDFAKFKTNRQEVEVIFRTEMQKEVRIWANSQDTYPTTPEIKAYMDEVQPQVRDKMIEDLKAAALDPTKSRKAPVVEPAPLTPYGNPGNDPGTNEANAAENWMRQSNPGDMGDSILPLIQRNDQ